MAVPAYTPTFPSTRVAPVFVTVDPARTPNVVTVGPRVTWAFRPRENTDQKKIAADLFTLPPLIQNVRFTNLFNAFYNY
jgi:hypothetical protein